MRVLRQILFLVLVFVVSACGPTEAQLKAEADDAAAKAKAEAEAREAARPKRATAILHSTENSVVTGIVSFVRDGEKLNVDVEFQGLKPGTHRFYIHEKGDCSDPKAESAGAIWKSDGQFGPIEANEKGAARMEFVDETISLEGPDSIFEKSVVIHFGPEPPAEGEPEQRLACGEIQRH